MLALSISALGVAIAGASCETFSNQEIKFQNYNNGDPRQKDISDFSMQNTKLKFCIAVTSVLAISQDDDDESLTIVLRRSITLALSQAAVGAVPESLLKVPH